jgi:hypothetical protein
MPAVMRTPPGKDRPAAAHFSLKTENLFPPTAAETGALSGLYQKII